MNPSLNVMGRGLHFLSVGTLTLHPDKATPVVGMSVISDIDIKRQAESYAIEGQ